MTPFTVKNKLDGKSRACPCGKCPACYKRRVSQWSFRLMQEEKRSISAHFITLTYNTKNVPITARGYMSLDKGDVPSFLKRLRKAHWTADPKYAISYPLRYYAVGEYGGRFRRPHYHLILFNADIKLIQDAWAKNDKHIGQVHYGTVTGASIGYCLKYLSKKSCVPTHKNDDRVPEFGLMSKGLGDNYLTPAMVKWHSKYRNDRMYVNIEGGKRVAMPRYYKDKLYSPEQKKAIGAHIRQRMDKEADRLYLKDQQYYAKKFQSDKAAFRTLDIKSKEGHKL